MIDHYHQEPHPVTTRIYVINGGAKPRLVRAGSKATAIAHVVRTTFTATVASQDVLVDAVGQGVRVETAGEEADGGEGGDA